jgi:hypothetical protein
MFFAAADWYGKYDDGSVVGKTADWYGKHDDGSVDGKKWVNRDYQYGTEEKDGRYREPWQKGEGVKTEKWGKYSFGLELCGSHSSAAKKCASLTTRLVAFPFICRYCGKL